MNFVHKQIAAVLNDPEPLLSLRSRMTQLGDLIRTFGLTHAEAETLVFAPLAARFAGRESHERVDRILATDVSAAHPCEVLSLSREMRLPEVAGGIAPEIELQRGRLVALQSAARSSHDLAVLLTEILTCSVDAPYARAFLLLDAHELPGEGAVNMSDAQEACLRRYGSAAGLEREKHLLHEAQLLAEELAAVYISDGGLRANS